jgi:hypothetical protein
MATLGNYPRVFEIDESRNLCLPVWISVQRIRRSGERTGGGLDSSMGVNNRVAIANLEAKTNLQKCLTRTLYGVRHTVEVVLCQPPASSLALLRYICQHHDQNPFIELNCQLEYVARIYSSPVA